MNRTEIFLVLALAFSTTAGAQYRNSDPIDDRQGVDNSSEVDRQAADTYYKNSVPPVPAAPLPPDRPADMRPKDINGSADIQAARTYRRNAIPPVPVEHNARPIYGYSHRMRHTHRRHHHRRSRHRVAARVIEHRADQQIVEPTNSPITIPPSR
jgi:hypothetical protein